LLSFRYEGKGCKSSLIAEIHLFTIIEYQQGKPYSETDKSIYVAGTRLCEEEERPN
jgi:hypothetical protein